MTDAILSLVPEYGLWLLAVIIMLSCLALPMPASLVMLTGGSFISSGDLGATATLLTAFLAAVSGDQIGFHLGKWGGAPILERIGRHGDRGALIDKARALAHDKGGPGVFLSRWLFSPLGPYVNFIGGATGLTWRQFTIWGALGEGVWVLLYVGLGYVFSTNIKAVADIAGNISGFLAAGAIAALLGWRILKLARGSHQNPGTER